MRNLRRFLTLAIVLGIVFAITSLSPGARRAAAQTNPVTVGCAAGAFGLSQCLLTLGDNIAPGGSFTASLLDDVGGDATLVSCDSIPAGAPCTVSGNVATFLCPNGCLAGSQFQETIQLLSGVAIAEQFTIISPAIVTPVVVTMPQPAIASCVDAMLTPVGCMPIASYVAYNQCLDSQTAGCAFDLGYGYYGYYYPNSQYYVYSNPVIAYYAYYAPASGAYIFYSSPAQTYQYWNPTSGYYASYTPSSGYRYYDRPHVAASPRDESREEARNRERDEKRQASAILTAYGDRHRDWFPIEAGYGSSNVLIANYGAPGHGPASASPMGDANAVNAPENAAVLSGNDPPSGFSNTSVPTMSSFPGANPPPQVTTAGADPPPPQSFGAAGPQPAAPASASTGSAPSPSRDFTARPGSAPASGGQATTAGPGAGVSQPTGGGGAASAAAPSFSASAAQPARPVSGPSFTGGAFSGSAQPPSAAASTNAAGFGASAGPSNAAGGYANRAQPADSAGSSGLSAAFSGGYQQPAGGAAGPSTGATSRFNNADARPVSGAGGPATGSPFQSSPFGATGSRPSSGAGPASAGMPAFGGGNSQPTGAAAAGFGPTGGAGRGRGR